MVMILTILWLLALLHSGLADPFGSSLRRRDSVVDLHIVKLPILPFNITFLQVREDYHIGIENVIEESVVAYLVEEFEEAYGAFYTLEMDNLPWTTEVEWPYVRINLSFGGNFIFVLSAEIPEESELHCLEQEALLDTYRLEFGDIFEFNETGAVELDYIQFDHNIFCPPSSGGEDGDEHALDGDEDDEDDDDGNVAPASETSTSHSKEKSINVKEFLQSQEFMFAVLATVVLPMLGCLICVCRKTRKVRSMQDLKATKIKRESGSSCSTRRTSIMEGAESNGSESSG